MNKKLLNLLGLLGLVLTVITGLYTLYHEAIENKNPIINILVSNTDHLTQSKIKGLSTNYTFNNRKINDLWVIDLKLVNIGPVTIIGKGEQKNIMNNDLKMFIPYPFKILEGTGLDASFDEANYAILSDTSISIEFSQWRPTEQIKFKIYIEGDTAFNYQPEFIMSDRQIINGEIRFGDVTDFISNRNLPLIKDEIQNKFAVNILGLLAATISLLTCFLISIAFVLSIINLLLYRKWHNINYTNYKLEVNTLVASGILLKEYHPSVLPEEFWPKLSMDKPPTESESLSDIVKVYIVLFMFFIGSLGAFIWTMPKTW